METPKTKVRVNIYGEEYAIRSEGDESYIREVAEYVDRKMRDIATRLPNKSPSRVAILAALNITDELFVEKNKETRGVEDMQKRAKDIISLLEDKLPESED